MRIVFDTNIYIAAALKGGFSEDILKIASGTTYITLLTTDAILEELREKLTQKFNWDESDVAFFISTIEDIAETIQINEKIQVITRHPRMRCGW